MFWKENSDKRLCLTFKISCLGVIFHCLFVRQHWSLPVITIMENCSLLEMMAVLNRDSLSKTAPAATTSQGKAMFFQNKPEASGGFVQSLIFCVLILNPNYRFLFEGHLKWRFGNILVWYLLGCTALLSFAMVDLKLP